MSTPASPTTHPVPGLVDRMQRFGSTAAVLGLLGCGIGLVTTPDQLFRSYLLGFLFWVGVGVGCLSLLMIQHLTGGLWGLVIRRMLEAGSRTLFFALVLFVPVALGVKRIFPWADAARLEANHLLKEAVEKKEVYLNVEAFLLRAVFYFVVWALLVHFLSSWSLQQDGGWTRKVDRRLRGLSGGGLILMGLTITFASVDWGMSLDPLWFSTIYGVLFMVGWGLSALAFVIVLVALMGGEEPFSDVVSPQAVHDLGKLMFAFVMLWAYISLSQFLIIWSANLPEEIPWYIHRLHGGWQWVALVLVVFHFALPFLLLLSRDLKRNARVLAMVAGGVLFVRLVDLFWLIAPEFHGEGLSLHWLDLAAPVGVGGVWLALFAWQLKGRPLLPVSDPELAEVLGPERGLDGAH